jgi:hypothetical protein
MSARKMRGVFTKSGEHVRIGLQRPRSGHAAGPARANAVRRHRQIVRTTRPSIETVQILL